MQYFIELPADVSRPAHVVLSSSEPRMYFGLPSSAGKHGPTKVVAFENASSDGGFYISIFPGSRTRSTRSIPSRFGTWMVRAG